MLSWVGQRVLANMRSDLFRHLQQLSLSYHDTHIVGVTVSRVMNDVATINELLSQGVITLMGDILVLVGIIIIMLTMNIQLALLTFIVLPLMILADHLVFAAGPGWLFARRAPGWPEWWAIWRKISPGCGSSRPLARKIPPRNVSTWSMMPTGWPISMPCRFLVYLPAGDRVSGGVVHRHRIMVWRAGGGQE